MDKTMAINLARDYRSRGYYDKEDPVYKDSVVVIRNGEAIGMNYLMYEAFFERPGTIYVDTDERVFLAVGRAACCAEDSENRSSKDCQNCWDGAQNWMLMR